MASNNTSPFMELPPELRKNIFEKVVEDDVAIISSRNRGGLSSSSALPRCSRQIRSEFFDALFSFVQQIETYVSNWDFQYVVSFVNRLRDQEIKTLDASKRTITIFLHMPYHRDRYYDLFSRGVFTTGIGEPAGLIRWLKRFRRSSKKGSAIDFQYTATGVKQDLGWWQASLRDLQADFGSGRDGKELLKIRAAIASKLSSL